MRAATLLALMGVSRPIYHLIISNEAILIVLIIYYYVVACLTCNLHCILY